MLPTVLAQLGGLRGLEFLILAVIIVVLLIKGPDHIPQLARAFGKARGEYEKGKQEFEREISRAEERAQLEDAARELGIDPEGKTDDELKTLISATVDTEEE